MSLHQAEKSILKVRNDYDKIAPHFAQTRKKETFPEFSVFAPYIKPHANILDVGCGTGRAYRFIKNLKVDVKYIGIDISEKQIEAARQEFPEVPWQVGNMLSLPFENNRFDIVLAVAALHHLPYFADRLQALQEIHRILRPGGTVCLTNWNLFQKQFWKYWPANIWRSIVTLGAYSWNDFFIPWKNNQGEVITKRYYHAFRPSELKKLAHKAGFQVLENDYTNWQEIGRMGNAYNLVTVLKKP